MRRTRHVLAVTAAVVPVLSLWAGDEPPPVAPGAPAVAQAVAAGSITGTWAGAIDLPGMALKVEVVFAGTAEAPAGTIDIPLQGARGLALANISVDGEKVRFAIDGIPGEPTFSGTMKGDAIAGDFSQAGATFPFELKRGELAKAKRPQTPKPPYPYTEEAVSVKGKDVELAGTLTRPPGQGPFPAVVLITGSGAQNRDEELFEHKPFAVLADALTRAGIIVVRYDDRGVGGSTGDMASATTRTFADDAELWVPVLKARKDVSHVGLAGHSEGGIVAPIVAARNGDVGFVVLLAGTGVNGRELLIEQNRALTLAGGGTKEAADAAAAESRKIFDALAEGAAEDRVRGLIREAAKSQMPTAGDAELDAVVKQQSAALFSPWFKEMLVYEPRETLVMVKVPVLAINGEKDAQVVPSQNLPAIEKALKDGGNKDVTVRELPGLNHLFQPCVTGSVAEYAQIEQTMDPAVLELIGGWIVERFAGGR